MTTSVIAAGCCPGQTGHHLMPNAMFRSRDEGKRDKAFSAWKSTYGGGKDTSKLTFNDMPRDKKPTETCWDGYAEGPAPTICLEGGDNTSGSHGAVHGLTEKLMGLHNTKPQMDYTTARSETAGLVSKLYGCDKQCLEAQMDEAYCKMYSCGKPGQSCDAKLKGAKVIPHSGMPGGGPKTSGGDI